MTEKTSGGYLPGSDPETIQANLNYQQAQQRLQTALEARRNRVFDPEMLALAQGFLAPTQTGGFGESLGLAAKNLREAQAQQEKEERDIAKSQLELAGMGLEVQRRKQREAGFQRYRQGVQPPAGALPGARPEQGALPSGQPSEEAPAEGALPTTLSVGAPPIPPGSVMIRLGPPRPYLPSGDEFLAAAESEGTMSLSDALAKASEINRRNFIESPGRVVDLRENVEYVSRYGTPVEIPIRNPITNDTERVTVDPATAAQLAAFSGEGRREQYDQLAHRVLYNRPMPKKTTEPAKAGEPREPGRPEAAPGQAVTPLSEAPTKILSSDELKARAAAQQKLAEGEVERQLTDKKEYLDAGKSVTSRMTTLNLLQPIASGKNAHRIFGVFERPTVAAAVFRLMEGGRDPKSVAANLSNLRDVITNLKEDQTLINQAQMAASLFAQVQLETSRLGQGQGQVSNFERDLFAQASLARSDNPAVILAKLDMLRARAELDRERANMILRHKGPIDDLVMGNKWQDATKSYEQKISKIFDQHLAGASVSPASGRRPAAPAGRDNRGSGERLDAQLERG